MIVMQSGIIYSPQELEDFKISKIELSIGLDSLYSMGRRVYAYFLQNFATEGPDELAIREIKIAKPLLDLRFSPPVGQIVADYIFLDNNI